MESLDNLRDLRLGDNLGDNFGDNFGVGGAELRQYSFLNLYLGLFNGRGNNLLIFYNMLILT